jgi:hypothetical protein
MAWTACLKANWDNTKQITFRAMLLQHSDDSAASDSLCSRLRTVILILNKSKENRIKPLFNIVSLFQMGSN